MQVYWIGVYVAWVILGTIAIILISVESGMRREGLWFVYLLITFAAGFLSWMVIAFMLFMGVSYLLYLKERNNDILDRSLLRMVNSYRINNILDIGIR